MYSPNDDREEVFNQIKHSASFIRRELASMVDLRKMPYLQFYLDNSIEQHDNIDKLIAQTKKESN